MGRFIFGNSGQDVRSRMKKTVILFLWLLIWQLAAVLTDNDILLAGPIDVGKALGKLLITREFYEICLSSMGRILTGFFMAFALGILAGGLFCAFPLAEEIFAPALSVMKSIPVASFVVLLLIWQGSKNLSVWISFFVVFPNACVSMKNGLKAVDLRLVEMADLFRIHGFRRLVYIYRPTLVLFLFSGMEICVGMAFKSGVAAEVIGVPDFSIGERIYISKIYLDTPGLFAWTVTLIVLSFLVEKLVLRGMALLANPVKAYGKGPGAEKNKTKAFGAYRQRRMNGRRSRKQEDEKQEDGKREDGKQEDGKQRNGKQEDGKRENGKQRNGKQENGKQEDETVKTAAENAVVLSHIYKSFGEKEVLSDVSMEIKKGGRYVLIGPSGSGKTTLLRIIAGLEQADSGRAEGKPRAAVLFQEDRLLESEFTITNFMLIAKGETKSFYEEAAAKILPKSCFFLPAHTLSGGMKRRCALARALFYEMDNKEAVCLLDEPFAGLDEETKKKAAGFIKEYLRGRTLIVAAHDEKDAELLGGSVWNMKKGGLR